MGISVPFVGMILVVLADVTHSVVSIAAFSKGTSKYILVFYSHALSSILLLPLPFIVHRSELPQLSFSIISSFFLLALIGCTYVTIGYAGIDYSSPTLSTAMLNLVPAFTFMLFLVFSEKLHLKKLHLKKSSGIAKSLGTVVSITGAFIVILYRGPPIISTMPSSFSGVNHQIQSFSHQLRTLDPWGIFLCSSGNINCSHCGIFWSLKVLTFAGYNPREVYPAVLVVAFFQSLFESFQSAVVSVIAEKDPCAWRLGPEMKSVAIVYTAVVWIVFQCSLTMLCTKMKGPLYVSMFKPLGIVAAALISIIFLGDGLYLGSVVGAVVIVACCYAFMWGKAKESRIEEGSGVGCSESSNQKVPLLQNRIQAEIKKHPVY